VHITEEKIKIIVTDDHALFRRGVINAFADKKDIQIIAEADNGCDLLQKLEHHKPDMIILNYNMPFMNGLETLPKLKEKYPGIKVIMLTMVDDAHTVCKMISLGANAYFTKSAGAEDICQGISYLRNNGFYMTNLVLNAFIQCSSLEARESYQFLDQCANRQI